MYLQGSLGGMGLDPSWITAGTALLKAGQGGAAPAGGNVAVNTSTQVSPQISPSFVQQMQPSNSPVTTGAYQTNANPLPGTPATGLIPGFDAGGSAPGFGANYLVPQTSAVSAGAFNPRTLAIIAGVALIAALIYRNRASLRGHVRRLTGK